MTIGRVYKVEAIILKRRAVGEADRIISLFTKQYGKLRVIAKGVRRPTSRRAAHLEVFTRGIFMLHRGRTLDVVTEATSLSRLDSLRKNMRKVNAGYYLCELTDALLAEKQEHEDVYVLLVSSMKAIEEASDEEIISINESFALELLRRVGFLAPDKVLATDDIDPYIERIIEKRLKTSKIVNQLA